MYVCRGSGKYDSINLYISWLVASGFRLLLSKSFTKGYAGCDGTFASPGRRLMDRMGLVAPVRPAVQSVELHLCALMADLEPLVPDFNRCRLTWLREIACALGMKS